MIKKWVDPARPTIWFGGSAFPSNNFAEFPGIFPGNPRKFLGIFHRKIQWKCRQLFRGISRNPFQGISCNPFRGNSHNSIQGISCNQFHGISCYQFYRKKLEKMSTKFVEILGNFQRKVLQNQFLGTIPKSSSGISWNILSIFLSKFTNQDLGPIIVNNLTTILPLQLFRSITIFSIRML